MRNKDPEERRSKKPRLSSDAAVLVALLKKQPLEKGELIKNARISDSSFSRDEPLLLREAIKIVNGRYVLINYESLDVDMEEIFKELKYENKDVVRIEELANKVGKPPEAIKEQAYSLGKKYGILIYYE
jgi:hypothetical protein